MGDASTSMTSMSATSMAGTSLEGSSSEESSLLHSSDDSSGSNWASGSNTQNFGSHDLGLAAYSTRDRMNSDDRSSERNLGPPNTYYWFVKGFKYLFTDETGNIFKRIKALAALQKVAASLMIFFGLLMFVLVGLANDGKEVPAQVCAGLVSFFAGISGLYAAIRRKEAAQRIYFVLEIWLLAMLTTYFYVALQGVGLRWNLCNPTNNFGSDSDKQSCERKLHAERGKVALGIIEFFVAIFSSILAMALNDALNDAAYQKYENSSRKTR